ncbi:MAG: hypothetical protein B6D59_01170 [Campylobacteraceae bacterium 4484_4]|nr:MAG: hypothetical protein B6D59_01170 [Campylobacteraceae bacterium 4484_4]
MNQYIEAKKLFRDDTDISGYFDSLTFEYAKRELIEAVNSHDTPLIFLLGDPGVGKSFLMHFLANRVQNAKIAKYFTHPYFEEKELLEALVSLTGPNVEHNQHSTQALINHLKKHFHDLEYTILIDEAQLLNEQQIELIRILSDMKLFQFVLAMHRKEGEFILQKPHFKSRVTKTIYLESLAPDEVGRYIEQRLLSHNLSDLATQFSKKHIRFIAETAKRNFRTTKKMLATLFEIMNLAHKGNMPQYERVDTRTLTMAAIDIGLIDVE